MEASVLSARAIWAQGDDEFEASEMGMEDACEERTQGVHPEGRSCIFKTDGDSIQRARSSTLVLGDYWGDLQMGHKWARRAQDVACTVS